MLVGILPVSADPPNTVLQLDLGQGQSVFLGEKNVPINIAQPVEVAFFKYDPNVPVAVVKLNNIDNFNTENHLEFNLDNLGPWHYWDGPTQTRGIEAFNLVQPNMSVLVRDPEICNNQDRTGTTVMNSQDLEFRVSIDDNVFIRQAMPNLPNPQNIVYDIDLSDGVNNYPNVMGITHPIPPVQPVLQQINLKDRNWGANSLRVVNPDLIERPEVPPYYWHPSALDNNGQYVTPPGAYTFKATCTINGLTVSSPINTLTLVKPSVDIAVAPSPVQRGIDTTVTITGEPKTDYYFGIIECPLHMTGAICDRPPWIVPDGLVTGELHFPPDPKAMDGDEPLVPNCCGGLPFNAVVPQINPPDGYFRWVVVTTDCNGIASFLVRSDENTWKASDLAEYTLHVQKINPEDDGTNLFDQTTLTLTKGDVTIEFFDAADPAQAPITEAFLGDLIGIRGTNTETAHTYLYMTGPCQPECGGSLIPTPYPYGLLGPGPDRVDVIGSSWTFVTGNFLPAHTWWDTSVLPINPGTYTIYALSGWSNACPDCVSCGGGTCELLDCPNCLVYAVGTITLKKPELEAEVIDIERCCCPGYPCGTTIDTQPIWVDGISTGNTPNIDLLTGQFTKDVNVWVFGKGKVGDKKFLNWREPIPCDGKFNFTIPWKYPRVTDRPDWDIPLCSLDPGTYDLIIQTHGYNQQYDVVKEEDILGTALSGGLPVEQNKRWIVSTYPVNAYQDLNNQEYPDYAKVVQVEGPGYKLGSEALQGLIRALENPEIDDQYVHLQFNITDRPCLGGANFEADRTYGNTPLTVRFTDLTQGGSSWLWDFGDGTTSPEQNPVHVYTNEGRYTVSLTIDEDAKGKAVKNDYIRVAKGPVANFRFTPDNGKAGETVVNFTDLSVGNPTTWNWDFGDGGISSLQSPSYTYPRPGVYTIKLTVSDEIGISSQSASQVITVLGEPVPQVGAGFRTVITGGTNAQFMDESIGSPTSWSWDFGDGSVSSEQNPKHVYMKEGTYQVTLAVANDLYKDSITKTVGIR
jgi:PKD repeat protein